jgi:hypothetical protein
MAQARISLYALPNFFWEREIDWIRFSTPVPTHPATLSAALERHPASLPIWRIFVRHLFAAITAHFRLLQVNIELSVTSCCKENSLQHSRQMLHSRHFAAKLLMGKELKAVDSTLLWGVRLS